MSYVWAYLSAITFLTVLVYAYDKFSASSNNLRVPEKNLHCLALFGGSIGAFFAQRIFRHKTLKSSFLKKFWLILSLQIIVVFVFLWLLK
ncbi:MAG: hypothetical protein KU37_03380 [Sulfuricurvum sp. PC08-66]|nr:MAG: hypothetical protein KU37_03380 [Sulfuricurvum sp. PC08-66]